MNRLYRIVSAGFAHYVSSLATFCLLSILLTVLPISGTQAQGVIDLGVLPGGHSSAAWAINNNGVIVGQGTVQDTLFHAIKWQNQQISSLYDGGPIGNDWVCARDVNSSGYAAGIVPLSVPPYRAAAKWIGGVPELLPAIPQGGWSDAHGINDSGWIVGSYIDSTFNTMYGDRAFLWKDGSVTKLPRLNSGGRSYARKINNNGIIVGYSMPGTSVLQWYGCAWFKGQIYTLPPASGYYQSFAFDINDSNTIVGLSSPDRDTWEGVVTIWKVTIVNGTDLQISAPVAAPLDYMFEFWYERASKPLAINNSDMVVGVGMDTLDNSTSLFIYRDGAFGDLSHLVDIPGSIHYSNSMIDINDSGQIVGIMRLTSPPESHGFLLTSRYLSVNMPAESALVMAGETNLISWMHLGVNTINIYYQIGDSPDLHLIVDGYPADNHYYVWDVPDTLLSTKVKIRIEDVSSSAYAVSKTFRVKGYVLTRLDSFGDYEQYRPDIHGWQFPNSANPMWPFEWYLRFDYTYGNDPNTNSRYPGEDEYPFSRSGIKTFVDWPLFTETFGLNQCYIPDDGGKLQYRRVATNLWSQNAAPDFNGSCFGFAQSSLLAFDRKDVFLSFFGLPDFSNLYGVPVSDSNRKVINRLFMRQLGDDENAYNAAASTKTAVDVLADLKAMMLSDINDHRSVSLFSNAPAGGHTMLPYRMIKDQGWSAAYRIYTYDSNNPDDTSIYILIDSISGRWYFGNLSWSENTPGTLRLDQPASHYLEPGQIFEPSKVKGPYAAKPDNGSGYMKVLFSSADTVRISGGGESFSYIADGGISLSGPLNAYPVIPSTGGPHRPIGLVVPEVTSQGGYEVRLTQLGDSNIYLSYGTDSIIWNYSRYGLDSTQDVLLSGIDYYGQPFLKSWCNDKTKLMTFGAIIPGDSAERSLDATILAFEPGNSLGINLRQDGDFEIASEQMFQTYCNLRLSQISSAGTSIFRYDSLHLDGETHYIIHQPNWDSLDTAPLKILIDHYFYGYGTIDDSVILNNQPTDVDESGDLGLPKTFQLAQNYPNPFNPVTTIEFALPHRANVVIEIFDILGRKVRQLVNETKAAGVYQVIWNGTDQSGDPVSTGVYLYRIQAGDFVASRKMLLIK